MNNEIQVEIKTIYGEERIYPACHTSHLLAEMLNQRTLTRKNIEKIKGMGFTVSVVPTVVTL